MNILYLCLRPPGQNTYIPPNEDVVHACVSPSRESLQSGKVLSLPAGEFEIEALLEQLPPQWQPDLCLISSSLLVAEHPPIPIGMNRLACPAALKLSDSHHGSRPLQGIIEYAAKVQCQYHWTIYDPHHLGFYQAAGLANVFWIPSAFQLNPQYQCTPSPSQQYKVLFCGSIDPYHHHRFHLWQALEKHEMPIENPRRFPQIESVFQAYNHAQIVFNCSLNGDFNLRIFEVLLAGGFLITDRLSPHSYLDRLFEEGKHLECYASQQELIQKVKHYLTNPKLCLEIAEQGHQHFIENYHPSTLRHAFYQFILHQEVTSPALLTAAHLKSSSLFHFSNRQVLKNRITCYELIQEIHRLNLDVNVLAFKLNDRSLLFDLETLPRLKLVVVNSAQDLLEYPSDACEFFTPQVVIVDTLRIWDELMKEISHFRHFALSQCNLVLFLVDERSHWLELKLKLWLLSVGFVSYALPSSLASKNYVAYHRRFAKNIDLKLPAAQNQMKSLNLKSILKTLINWKP